MSVSVFNDEKLQQQFDKDGYIVVTFLSNEEVARLKNLYAEVSLQIPASFHSTSFSTDDALKQKINDAVEKIYSSKAEIFFHDIKKLLTSFNALVEQGHSLIIIEHNTDVIKSADWIIDLGPEAGDAGGNLVYAGIPKK